MIPSKNFSLTLTRLTPYTYNDIMDTDLQQKSLKEFNVIVLLYNEYVNVVLNKIIILYNFFLCVIQQDKVY